jgi:hypothetical protein
MKIRCILLSFVLLALVMGCAKPPITEMENAREAVLRAENDEDAVIFGSSSLARARDALRRMQVEADSKNFDAARTHAQDAVTAAERAVAEGRMGAARAQSESEALLAGLAPAIEEASRNINGARYNNLPLDYNQLNNDLNEARDSADRAEDDHANGRYNDSIENGRRARAVVGSINERITSVATAASVKK